MKNTSIVHQILRVLLLPVLAVCFAVAPHHSLAREGTGQNPAGKFSPEELAQMMAPIALYPDAFLSQLLMASTYPIEVIEADRWVKAHADLKGESLDDALLQQDWDASVKAMCHFPEILSLMSERIGQTAAIGNAFLAQEDEVMDTIQELRAKAYARGNLASSAEQKVMVEKETIIIEPADPKVVYVPYYDPYTIYGPWWYPAYPPYYWGPVPLGVWTGISYWPGFYFGVGFGWSWSYFDWHYHSVYIDAHRRPPYVRHDGWHAKPGSWAHEPRHRRGVVYRDRTTGEKYGYYHPRTKRFRPEPRGFSGPNNRRGSSSQRPGGTAGMMRQALQGPQKENGTIGRRQVSGGRYLENSQATVRLPAVSRDGIETRSRGKGPGAGSRQVQQRQSAERRTLNRAERQRQQRGNDTIFAGVGDGRQVREFSAYRQYSRQGGEYTPGGPGRPRGDSWGGSGMRAGSQGRDHYNR